MIDPLAFDLNGIRVRDAGAAERRQSQRARNLDGLLVVLPFTVVVDTREQLPYEFSGMTRADGIPVAVPTVRRGLESGDYSIDGMEERVMVERKSLDDLYSSVTWERDRFENEIVRMNWSASQDRLRFACVVIEASWPEIVAPAEYRPGWENQTKPASVEGTIIAWSIRYPRVSWWACGDRRGAECRTLSILTKFWDEQQG